MLGPGAPQKRPCFQVTGWSSCIIHAFDKSRQEIIKFTSITIEPRHFFLWNYLREMSRGPTGGCFLFSAYPLRYARGCWTNIVFNWFKTFPSNSNSARRMETDGSSAKSNITDCFGVFHERWSIDSMREKKIFINHLAAHWSPHHSRIVERN